MNKKEKINVGYFGRFENVQKGFMNFINSVNLLGKEFKEKNNVEYFLYGRGEISNSVDLSLFNPPEFLTGEDLYQAYSKMDIVVMPSRYEPFGLTGLEAMASGCLLLATTGLGMDSYMDVGKNCLAIPQNSEGISLVLKDAIKPNLVQTLENNPAIIHGGPFANIAHGCNSIIATKLGLSLADYVVTEAGFGSDLGAEKFLDIKCPKANLKPNCIVINTTIRSLKYNGNNLLEKVGISAEIDNEINKKTKVSK